MITVDKIRLAESRLNYYRHFGSKAILPASRGGVFLTGRWPGGNFDRGMNFTYFESPEEAALSIVQGQDGPE